MANEMTRKTQASAGHRQVPVRKCKAAQRDREASLDRCAVRMRAGDESEEAKQGRQKLRPPRELVYRYLPGIRSAPHQAGTPLHEPRVPALFQVPFRIRRDYNPK